MVLLNCQAQIASERKTWLWGIPFFILTLLSTVCFQPLFARDAQLDVSCFFCNGFAFAQRLRFGVDFLGSYGPWGFAIHNLYQPKTMGWMIAGQCIISTGMFFGLWRVGRNLGIQPLVRGLWVLMFSMWDVSVFEDGHILTICLLPMLIRRTYRDGRDSIATYAVVLVLALAGLCKFTFFVLGTAVIVLLCLEDLRRRRWPRLGIWFAAMVVLLWRIAGQRIADLPTYLWREWVLSRAYSESVGIEPLDRFLVPTVAALGTVICFMVLCRFWKENRLGAVVAFLTTAATLFVCFKEGFVRSTGPSYVATTGLAISALMLTPVFWIWRTTSRRKISVAAFRLLSGFVLIAALWRLDPSVKPFWPPIHPSALLAVDFPTMQARAQALWQWIRQGNRAFDSTYQSSMERIRKNYPLPFRSGTVDMFGANQLAVLAAGMNYHPRPISPGFQAWSPELIEMNRRFLVGDAAPENIFFEREGIDNRFPALEDGKLWPELMSRYSPSQLASKDLLVLHRDVSPRPYSFTLISSGTYRLGEDIAVPSSPGKIIWTRIELQQTPIGKLATTLLRGPQVDLDVTTADSVKTRYRLVPGMAQAGFVLSPLVRNAQEFFTLMTDPTPLPPVKEISIHVQPTRPIQNWYDPRMQITFQQLEVAMRK
jgi:hypothetical protein